MIFENIKPKELLKHFYNISQIPRGSGNEKEISDYLVKFAKDRNLEVIQDKALNVIIKKSGTKGYENSPVVVIQGHLDMVPEKNNDTNHNFLKDSLKLYIDGDLIKAHGTTLGADNGVCVAASMAILDSTDINHPPLEILLTTNEEVGLIGAMELDKKNISGRILLNLDSDTEGVFLTSCAGGMRTDTVVNIEKENNKEGFVSYKLEVKGLSGGHSGIDIVSDRANSNILLIRIFYKLIKDFDINIYNLSGGAQDNAIPRESFGLFTMAEIFEDEIKKQINELESIFKKEFHNSEKNIVIEIAKTNDKVGKVFKKEFTNKIICGIISLPNGVYAMSKEITGLVETSNNIAVLKTSDIDFTITSSIRSSVLTKKELLFDKHKCVANLMNGEISTRGDYPSWEYNPNSKVRDIALKAYKNVTGYDGEVGAIHAGLECGVFAGKISNLDMVSFGANIYNAHTPEEAVSILSLEKFYNVLLEILKDLK